MILCATKKIEQLLRPPAPRYTGSGTLLQRCDALFERRVAHEQSFEPHADPAANAESLHRFGQLTRLLAAAQLLQCRDHLAAPGQPRAAGVCAKLAPARKRHDDDAGENAENDLQ